MSNALKFLLLAAGCAVAILLITVGVKMANKGKDDVDGNLEQYSEAASTYEDIDLKVYDAVVVSGSEIKRLITNNAKDKFISVKVTNGKGDTEDYINVSTITTGVVTIGSVSTATLSTDPSADNYINDTGNFMGEVLYDKNGVVACIHFTQQ